MREHPKYADVYAWGKKIAMLEEHNGKIFFQYADNNTLNFSPFKVAFDTTVQDFSYLSFQKQLPGFISDVLPGQYGQLFLNKFYRDHYGSTPTVIEELLFLSDHALGALSFQPSESEHLQNIEHVLDVKQLIDRSRKVISNEEQDFDLATLIAISNASAGGAKAKAIVGFNPDTKKIFISHKHAQLPPGFRYVIVKFDEDNAKQHTFLDIAKDKISVDSKLEYIYSLCAKSSGIVMPETWLLEDEKGFHFIVERFDHVGDDQYHMHSFAGLHHNDASPQSISYEMLFRTGISLLVAQKDKEQMFYVMLFNLIFSNKYDHAKNFSFLMDKSGQWSFAPAYDLTFSTHESAIAWHQLTIGGKAVNIPAKSIREVAETFKVTDYKEIIATLLEIRENLLPKLMQEHEVAMSIYNDIVQETEVQCKLLKELL